MLAPAATIRFVGIRVTGRIAGRVAGQVAGHVAGGAAINGHGHVAVHWCIGM